MQEIAKLEYDNRGLFYTFVLSCGGDKEELTINVVRRERYALWKTTIVSEGFGPVGETDVVQVKYSPSVKFRIIVDHISNQLDDVHRVIFPDTVDANQAIRIGIEVSCKYGSRTFIMIQIHPVFVTEIEKCTNDLIFQKESMGKEIESLRNRVIELESLVEKFAALQVRVDEIEKRIQPATNDSYNRLGLPNKWFPL